MPNTREKLRELIKESIRESGEVCCNNVCDRCQYNKYGNDCGFAARADIFIANGVTFATDNNVGDKREEYERGYERGEWEMFELITSAYYGKQYYSLDEYGIAYSRASHKSMPRDEAIEEFLDAITW